MSYAYKSRQTKTAYLNMLRKPQNEKQILKADALSIKTPNKEFYVHMILYKNFAFE